MNERKHRGSGFREFLDEQGILGEVEAVALKRTGNRSERKLISRNPGRKNPGTTRSSAVARKGVAKPNDLL